GTTGVGSGGGSRSDTVVIERSLSRLFLADRLTGTKALTLSRDTLERMADQRADVPVRDVGDAQEIVIELGSADGSGHHHNGGRPTS
ncbi:unnamed protein product, partial [Phaeothamnion confervicola]